MGVEMKQVRPRSAVEWTAPRSPKAWDQQDVTHPPPANPRLPGSAGWDSGECRIRHHVFASQENSFHLLPFSFLCGYVRSSKDSRFTFCFHWAHLLGDGKKVDRRKTAAIRVRRAGCGWPMGDVCEGGEKQG